MFAEELTKIQESEAKAEQLQKQAKLDAKKALEDANAKAAQIADEAGNRAKDIYDSLLTEGQKISDQEYEEFLASTKEQCLVMAAQAQKNENKAVNLIAERIVNASVNR